MVKDLEKELRVRAVRHVLALKHVKKIVMGCILVNKIQNLFDPVLYSVWILYKMDFIRIKNKRAADVHPKKRVRTSEPVKLINKGKYGCIYKPGIRCSGKPWPVKYISKIQVIRSATSREVTVGKLLRKMVPNFAQYFAPILSSCPIDISVIDKEEVRKCDVIQENVDNLSTRFSSNKIRYVGEMTLGDFLLDTFVKRPRVFMKEMVHTHQYLLKSLGLMEGLGLVHYDLKENNVVYDSEQSAPIVIDFGLAFLAADVGTNAAQYKQYFYDPYEKYPPWCFDTVLLSHIADVRDLSAVLAKEDIVALKQRLQVFVEKNDAVLVPFISEGERDAFMMGWSGYLDSFLGKSWNDLWKSLFSQHASWDNYSIAVVYFMIMEQFSDLFLGEGVPVFVQSYISLLKRVVLWVPLVSGTSSAGTTGPSARLTALTMKSDFALIFKGVKGKEYADFVGRVETVSRDKKLVGKVEQGLAELTLEQLEDSGEIGHE